MHPNDTRGVTTRVLEKVKQIAQEWTMHANLRFNFLDPNQPMQPKNADIRIFFKEGCGHYSKLGTDCKHIAIGEPTMNLDPIEINETYLNGNPTRFRQIVLHEFGHALGCIHEHQQPAMNIQWDEDAVFNYYRGLPNKWSDAEIRHNVLELSQEGIYSTRFDERSIMLYEVPSKLTKNDVGLEGGKDLSASDIKFIKECYPRTLTHSVGCGPPFPEPLPSIVGLSLIPATGDVNAVLTIPTTCRWSWLDSESDENVKCGKMLVPRIGKSVSIPIKFTPGYPDHINPTVCVWAHSLQTGKQSEFKIAALNVTSSGFDLDLDLTDICMLEVGWLAFPPSRKDIDLRYEQFRIEDFDGSKHTHTINLPPDWVARPDDLGVFVAFNTIRGTANLKNAELSVTRNRGIPSVDFSASGACDAVAATIVIVRNNACKSPTISFMIRNTFRSHFGSAYYREAGSACHTFYFP